MCLAPHANARSRQILPRHSRKPQQPEAKPACMCSAHHAVLLHSLTCGVEQIVGIDGVCRLLQVECISLMAHLGASSKVSASQVSLPTIINLHSLLHHATLSACTLPCGTLKQALLLYGAVGSCFLACFIYWPHRLRFKGDRMRMHGQDRGLFSEVASKNESQLRCHAHLNRLVPRPAVVCLTVHDSKLSEIWQPLLVADRSAVQIGRTWCYVAVVGFAANLHQVLGNTASKNTRPTHSVPRHQCLRQVQRGQGRRSRRVQRIPQELASQLM